MRTRLRFEILKRDRFTCVFCGKHPPEVLLEVDHLVPKSAGGTDDPTNLVASCTDCNRGKADRILQEGLTRSVAGRNAKDLRKRLKQAREFAAVEAEIEEFLSGQVDRFLALWTKSFGGTLHDGFYRVPGGFPSELRIREAIRDLGLQSVLDAARATAERFSGESRGSHTLAYFGGVIRNMRAERRDPDVS